MRLKGSISSRYYIPITINCDNGIFDYVFVSIFYFIFKRNNIRCKYPFLGAKRQEAEFFTFDLQNVGM